MAIHVLQCLRLLDTVAHLSGDVIELGVGDGQNTFALGARVSRMAIDKTVYGCDTFSGLPYDDEIPGDNRLRTGEMNRGAAPLGIQTPNVVIVPGLIEDTLPRMVHLRFCFAWIDLDVYQATSFAYTWLRDRVVPGGILGFHDYGHPRCPGVRRVVDQEVDRSKYQMLEHVDRCVFFRRLSEVSRGM